jgi:predicted nucleotide-binding protein (sugar kinase/HSP70/actin superfamily)
MRIKSASIFSGADSSVSILSWSKADTFITYTWMKHWEQKLMKAASPFLDDRHEPRFQECLEIATPYIPFYLGGEGKLSVGRAIKFAQQGAAMVVNCAPFGCMPETVATAIFGRLSADVDMPIVSLFYDCRHRHSEVPFSAESSEPGYQV